ncbi:MAG: hypothetical protein KDK36_16260 [Leptospiraceae bacterium]|nr:hypothetical protein [Leptospiraceae bacterium]
MLINKLILITFYILFMANCLNSKDKFYTFQEANAKVLLAFAAKDSACGTVHTITTFIPGEPQKSDIDSCVKVIQALDCSTWSAGDPTPLQCKAIEFKLK